MTAQGTDRERDAWARRLAAIAGQGQRPIKSLGESVDGKADLDGPLPHVDDLINAVDRATRHVEAESNARAKALDVLAGLTGTAISKISTATGNPALAIDEVLAFEAIIRADGSRPSLLLQDGVVPASSSFVGQWVDQIFATQSRTQEVAQATGRIQPAGGGPQNYFGSGFLIDRERGFVLTNRHVVADILQAATVTIEGGNVVVDPTGVKHYRVLDGLTMDFDGEVASDKSSSVARVVELRIPPRTGASVFEWMDIALLRLEFDEDSTIPLQAVPYGGNPVFETEGEVHSICMVGFPGPPQRSATTEIDWDWVEKQLFAEAYGVKRLAPGLVHRSAGWDERDTNKWIFGHDATTLGGSSGSPVFAWLDGGQAFGIHFSGRHSDTNRAHGFSTSAAKQVIDALTR